MWTVLGQILSFKHNLMKWTHYQFNHLQAAYEIHGYPKQYTCLCTYWFMSLHSVQSLRLIVTYSTSLISAFCPQVASRRSVLPSTTTHTRQCGLTAVPALLTMTPAVGVPPSSSPMMTRRTRRSQNICRRTHSLQRDTNHADTVGSRISSSKFRRWGQT